MDDLASMVTPRDWDIIQAILQDARAEHAASQRPDLPSPHAPEPQLLIILRAYERILPGFGLTTQQDHVIYRLLLKLSLLPQPSWDDKIAAFKASAASSASVTGTPAHGNLFGTPAHERARADGASLSAPLAAALREVTSPALARTGPTGTISLGSPVAAAAAPRPPDFVVQHQVIAVPTSNPQLPQSPGKVPGSAGVITKALAGFRETRLPLDLPPETASAQTYNSRRSLSPRSLAEEEHDTEQTQLDVAMAADLTRSRTLSKAFRAWSSSMEVERAPPRSIGKDSRHMADQAPRAHFRAGSDSVRSARRVSVPTARREKSLDWEVDALERATRHWAANRQSAVLRGWQRVVANAPKVSVNHPVQIKGLMKWITLTLPDQRIARQLASSIMPGVMLNGALALSPGVAVDHIRSFNKADWTTDNQRRLARLRAYVLGRVMPSARTLPLLEHANAILDAFTVLRIFATWRSCAERLSGAKSLVRQLRRRAFLRRWCGAAATHRQQRVAAQTLSVLHSTYTVARAWFAWRRVFLRTAQLSDKVAEGTQRIHRSRARRAVLLWKKRANTSATARQWIDNTLHSTQMNAFVAWWRWAQRRGQARRLARQFHEKVSNAQRRFILHAWRELLDTAAVADTFFMQYQLRRALACWRRRIKLRHQCDVAVRRWMHGILSSAFNTWEQRVQRTRATAVSVQRITATHAARSSLRAWSQACQARRLAARVVRTWQHVSVFRVFCAWVRRAHSARYHRTAMQAVSVTRRMRLVSGAIRAWHREALGSLRLKAALAECTTRRDRMQRTVILRLWQHRAINRQQMRFVLMNWKRCMQARAVRTWLQRAKERARKRRLLQAAIKRMYNHLVAAAMTTWTAFVMRRKVTADLRARALVHSAELRKRFAIRRWRACNTSRRRIKLVCMKALRRLMLLSAARCLDAWRDHMRGQTQWRAFVNGATGELQQSSSLRSLRRWRTVASARAAMRATMVHVVRVLQASKLAASVRKWHAVATTTHRIRQKLQIAVEELTWGKLQHALERWITHTRAARTGRALVGHAAEDLLMLRAMQTTRTWRAWSHRQRRERELTTKAVGRFRHLSVARAFSAWNHYVAEAKIRRARSLEVVEVLFHRLATACVKTWRSRTAEAREARLKIATAVRRMRLLHVARAWLTWQHLVNGRRERRAAAEQSFKARLLQQMSVAFRAWKADAERARGVNRVHKMFAEQLMHSHAARCVLRWQSMTQFAAKQREMASTADIWREARVLRSHLRAWQQVLNRALARRSALHVLADLATRAVLRHAVASWGDHASRKTRALLILQRSVVVWGRARVARAFRALREHARERQRQRLLMRDTLRRMQQSNLVRVLLHWQATTHTLRRMRTIIARFQQQKLLRALRTWHSIHQQNALRKDAIRGTAARFITLYHRGTLVRVWMAWASWAHRRRKLSRASDAVHMRLRLAMLAKHAAAWRASRAAAQLWRVHVLRRVMRTISWVAARRRAVHASQAARVRRHKTLLLAAWCHRARKQAQQRNDTSAFVARMQATTKALPTARRALMRWRLSREAAALSAWQHVTQRRAHLRRVQDDAVRSLTARSKRLCLRAWCAALKAGQLLRIWKGVADKVSLRGIFNSWRDAVQMHRALVARRLPAVHVMLERRARRQLAAAWTAWVTMLEGARMREARAMTKFAEAKVRVLRGCLIGWQTYAAHSTLLRRVAAAGKEAISKSRLRAAVCRWSSRAQSNMPVRKATSQCIVQLRLRPAVAAWRLRARSSRKEVVHDKLATAARLAFFQRKLGRLLVCWHVWARRRRQEQRAQRMVFVRTNIRVLAQILRHWCGRARERKATREQYQLARVITAHAAARRAVCGWRDIVAWMRYKRGAAAHAASMRERRIMSAVVQSWQRMSKDAQARRTYICHARTDLLNGRLAGALGHWLQVTYAARRARHEKWTAEASFRERATAKAVRAWRRAAHSAVERRRAASMVAASSRRRLRMRAMIALTQAAHEAVVCKRYRGVLASRRARECLRAWRSAQRYAAFATRLAITIRTQLQRRVMNQMQLVVLQHKWDIATDRIAARSQRLLSRAFAALQSYAVHRQSKRFRTHTARQQVSAGALQRMFVGWRMVVQHSVQYRREIRMHALRKSKLEALARRQQHRVLLQAFASWHTRVRFLHRIEGLQYRFALKSSGRDVLLSWMQIAKRRGLLRARYHHAVHLMASLRASKFMGAWQRALERSRRLRHATSYANERFTEIQKQIQGIVFGCWVRLLDRKRAFDAFQGELSRRKMRMQLQTWSQNTAAVRFHRIVATARVFHAMKLVYRTAAYHRAATLELALQEAERSRLATVVRAWSQAAAKLREERAQRIDLHAFALQRLTVVRARAFTQRWQAHVATRHHARLAESRIRRHQLRRVLHRWCLVASVTTARKSQGGLAREHFRRRMLLAIFGAWRGIAHAPSLSRVWTSESSWQLTPAQSPFLDVGHAGRGASSSAVHPTVARSTPAAPATPGGKLLSSAMKAQLTPSLINVAGLAPAPHVARSSTDVGAPATPSWSSSASARRLPLDVSRHLLSALRPDDKERNTP